MNNDWSMTINGTGKPCAEWGIEDVSLTRENQAADTLTFTAPAKAYDADLPYDYGALVALYRAGGRVFYGKITSIERAAAPDDESVTVTCAGPWDWLDKIVFLQLRQEREGTATDDDDEAATVTALSGRLVLNQTLDGQPMSTAAQIRAVLDYAVSHGGAPLAVGEMPEDVIVPWSEIKCVTCAQVIVNMLRWTPDAVAWFDYAPAVPVLHLQRRAAGAVKSLALHDGVRVSGNRLTARRDLMAPCVALLYERGAGAAGTVMQVDVFPPGGNLAAPGSVVMTIDLYPGSASFADYHVDYDAINLEAKEWWQKKANLPAEAEDVVIEDAQKPPRCNREVVGGSFPPGFNNALIDAQITAKISYRMRNSTGAETKYYKTPMVATLTATDEVQQDWHLMTSQTAAEEPPVGLAEKIYQAVSELQFEGQIELTEEEADPAAWHPGMLLNLTGGRAEWAAARAQLQRVNYDLAAGRTTLVIGPTAMLSATDLIELLRAARQRVLSNYPSIRIGGTGNAPVKTGGKTANRVAGSSEAFVTKRVMADGDDNTGSRKIILALDDINFSDTQGGNIEVRLRKVAVCVGGEQQEAYVLMSNPF